jgi:hypothetical protein
MSDGRCDRLAAPTPGNMNIEPDPPKGLMDRAKGMALKGGTALLLAFIAYHVAFSALKAIGFWIGSAALGGTC